MSLNELYEKFEDRYSIDSAVERLYAPIFNKNSTHDRWFCWESSGSNNRQNSFEEILYNKEKGYQPYQYAEVVELYMKNVAKRLCDRYDISVLYPPRMPSAVKDQSSNQLLYYNSNLKIWFTSFRTRNVKKLFKGIVRFIIITNRITREYYSPGNKGCLNAKYDFEKQNQKK